MNVLKYEMKINMKSTIVWAIALGLLGFVFISIFPAYTSDVEALKTLMASYPPEVLKAFGLGNAGIETFNGFYSFCVVYLIFVGAIQALILGINVISKEKTRKTSDFLFTKPMNRLQILGEKFITVFICIIFTNIIYLIVTYFAAITYVEKIDWNVFFLLVGALFFTQIMFLSFGFFMGCLFNKIKSPVTIGIGIGALFFALEMVANMYNDTALKYLSPMSYLNPSYIVDHHSYEVSTFITGTILTLCFIVLGFYLYKTKDINA
ncbi:ABC transporter permease subunit [Bacillus massiliigorillae]|uniref:ABC transporter permease subunit n=1 Tax=Bacillus massiliigorillae TaxID=1243664 RepID=UPI00039AF7AC|nr:ABC transporter permease subunit [Bacillus massiliigorillae]